MTVEQQRSALWAIGFEWSWFLHTQEQGGSLFTTEYHDIVSLDTCELGCTDLAWHDIKVMDDEPFKERFRWIP